MAKEITISQTATQTIPGLQSLSWNLSTKYDASDPATAQSELRTFTTSDALLKMETVSAPRFLIIQNKDAVNALDVGPEFNGVIAPFIRIPAGGGDIIPLSPEVNIRTRAVGAAVTCLVQMWG